MLHRVQSRPIARPQAVQRGISKAPRDKTRSVPKVKFPAKHNQVASIEVVQRFKPLNDEEYNDWQTYVETLRVLNPKQLKTIKDFSSLAISLVKSEEIYQAAQASRPEVMKDPEERNNFLEKLAGSLSVYLSSHEVLQLPPKGIDDMGVVGNPYSYPVSSLPGFMNEDGQLSFGHFVEAELPGRLKNSIRGHLETEFDLSLHANPNRAKVNFGMRLWDINDGKQLNDINLNLPDQTSGAPSTISIGRPELSIIRQ